MANSLDRSVELTSNTDDGTIVEVVASIDEDGNLIMFGHGVGRAPDTNFSSETYDHWVVVGGEDKDLVLLQLLRERFLSTPTPSAEFLEWLQDLGIAHEVASTAGEHRGAARAATNGHRRNGRRMKTMRAGP